MRREVALRAGLFDESVERRQDMEFLVRLAKAARCALAVRARIGAIAWSPCLPAVAKRINEAFMLMSPLVTLTATCAPAQETLCMAA